MSARTCKGFTGLALVVIVLFFAVIFILLLYAGDKVNLYKFTNSVHADIVSSDKGTKILSAFREGDSTFFSSASALEQNQGDEAAKTHVTKSLEILFGKTYHATLLRGEQRIFEAG